MLDEQIADMIERRRKEQERARISEATNEAAKSGGIAGTVLGGAADILSGNRSIPKFIGKAALGGALGAGLTGGATWLGSEVMGAPDADSRGGFTNRTALGGALAGGALGAGLGGLLGGGKLAWLGKIGPIEKKLAEAAKPASDITKKAGGLFDNLLADKIKTLAKKGPGRTAGALGLAGAGIGGFQGAQEGMGIDYLESLKDDEDVHGPF